MSPAVIDALLEAGASAEMIAAAWKASLATTVDVLAERRERDAARKRASRAAASADSPRTSTDSADIADGAPPILDKETLSPKPPIKENNPTPRVCDTREVGSDDEEEENEADGTGKGTRIPHDWRSKRFSPDSKAREVIDRRGQEWSKAERESFRRWALAATGRAAIKRDWQQAFGNWIIRRDREDTKNGNDGSGNNGGFTDALTRAAAKFTGGGG